MIFVTVGTHEQQFNRLIKEVDELKSSGYIKEKVIIQTGYSDYVPNNCEYKNFLTYNAMNDYIDKSSLVITHGGPASFLNVIIREKPLIVVPRRMDFKEHVNNHQIEFLEKLSSAGFNIEVVREICQLKDLINKVNDSNKFESNNLNFVQEFKREVEALLST